MDIIAIYKTFHGDEFVIPSLESIYQHCSKIIFVHCDKSWGGREGNTVRDVVLDWCNKHDDKNKVINITIKDCDQTIAYKKAWAIASKHEHDWKFLIDTDEVWAQSEIKKLLHFAVGSTANTITSSMYEYIKSPLFQITPTPPLHPVVMVRNNIDYVPIRCSGYENTSLSPAYFHHFTLVRRSIDEIIAKQSECCNVENEETVEWENWIRVKWNSIPNAFSLKPLPQHAGAWESVKQVSIEDLPTTMHNHSLTKAFASYNFTRRYPNRDRIGLTELDILKKYGLPQDFGPGHERWGIPSTMNKYRAMMEELARV